MIVQLAITTFESFQRAKRDTRYRNEDRYRGAPRCERVLGVHT